MASERELHIESASREKAAALILANLSITVTIMALIFLSGEPVDTFDPVDLVFEGASAITAFALFAAATLIKVTITSRPALLTGLFLFQLGRGLDTADEVIRFDSTLWSVTGDLLALVGEVLLAIIAFAFVRRSNELMNRDGLTQLHNRNFHKRKLASLLKTAARKGHQVAVIALDLDYFKKVNDRHGHAYGDMVLQHVARTLSAAAQPGEVVSRTGGEEFEIIVPVAPEDHAQARAEAFRTAMVNNPPDRLDELTASIGVALGAGAAEADSLRKRADDGAYQSKSNGRNQVTLVRAAKAS